MRKPRARTPNDCRELLRVGRWFRGLPDALQDGLLAASRVRVFVAGARIFSRGDAPSGLFAVLAGSVRVTGTAPDGKEVLLTLVDVAAWFGEISLFDALPRTHDAIAEGETTVLHVPQQELDALLAAAPHHWRDLALLMTHKLRLLFVVVEEAASLPIGTRLARRLVTMVEGNGEWHDRRRRVVAVKQEQLAAMLAISRQTANEALRRLEAQGVLRLTYGGIEIVDEAALRVAALR